MCVYIYIYMCVCVYTYIYLLFEMPQHITSIASMPLSLLFPKPPPGAYPNSLQSPFRGSHQIGILYYGK